MNRTVEVVGVQWSSTHNREKETRQINGIEAALHTKDIGTFRVTNLNGLLTPQGFRLSLLSRVRLRREVYATGIPASKAGDFWTRTEEWLQKALVPETKKRTQ